MNTQEFLDAAAIQIAKSERERYDFTSPDHYTLFAEKTWKIAQALADKRPAQVQPENLSAEIAELKKEIAAMSSPTITVLTDQTISPKEVIP